MAGHRQQPSPVKDKGKEKIQEKEPERREFSEEQEIPTVGGYELEEVTDADLPPVSEGPPPPPPGAPPPPPLMLSPEEKAKKAQELKAKKREEKREEIAEMNKQISGFREIQTQFKDTGKMLNNQRKELENQLKVIERKIKEDKTLSSAIESKAHAEKSDALIKQTEEHLSINQKKIQVLNEALQNAEGGNAIIRTHDGEKVVDSKYITDQLIPSIKKEIEEQEKKVKEYQITKNDHEAKILQANEQLKQEGKFSIEEIYQQQENVKQKLKDIKQKIDENNEQKESHEKELKGLQKKLPGLQRELDRLEGKEQKEFTQAESASKTDIRGKMQEELKKRIKGRQGRISPDDIEI